MTKVITISRAEGVVHIHEARDVTGSAEGDLSQAIRTSLRTGNPIGTGVFAEFVVRRLNIETQGRVIVEISGTAA